MPGSDLVSICSAIASWDKWFVVHVSSLGTDHRLECLPEAGARLFLLALESLVDLSLEI
jgi:hypothetical protein